MTTLQLFPTEPALSLAGPAFEVLSARAWIFSFARELRSPNRTIWSGRWALASDRAWWERAFRREIREWLSMRTITGMTTEERAAWPSVLAHRERRRVTVTRFVPSTRHFIRDDDNLQFSTKGVRDSLVHVQLVVDDRREWLICAPVTQHVSPDGRFSTTVLLQRPDLSGTEV